MKVESVPELVERAAYFFRTWAPAVLRCDGDVRKEEAALRHRGVSEARSKYDLCIAKIERLERQSLREAQFEAQVRALTIDAALERR